MFHDPDDLPLTSPHHRPEPLVTHLVFVDGRLVETRHEPVAGSDWEWQHHLASPPTPPPPPPPPPLHQQVLEWLDEVCGGRAAVDGLHARPLDDDAIDLPDEYADRRARPRMEETAELLDSVAAQCFDVETSFALRHALLAVWAVDPDVVLRPTSGAHVAAGICWAVGKANGLFHPVGTTRVGRLQEVLALRSAPSSQGRPVALALRGFRGRALGHGRAWFGAPDLEPLGRTDVLLGSTRQRLLRIRDRAYADAA